MQWLFYGWFSAQPVFLIPADNPKPTYPKALFRAGVTGEVRVSFSVQSDGSVHKVTVPVTAQPELAEAARSAVRQWRFRPWEVTDEQQAHLHVVAPMVFRLDDTPPVHANETLKKLPGAADRFVGISEPESPPSRPIALAEIIDFVDVIKSGCFGT